MRRSDGIMPPIVAAIRHRGTMPSMDDPTPTVDAPSKPGLRFRRMRIALSVFFGLMAVAICVLWGRSYWKWDALKVTLPNHRVGVASIRGTLGIGIGAEPPNQSNPTFAELSSGPITVEMQQYVESITTLGFGFHAPSSGRTVIIPMWVLFSSCLGAAWACSGVSPGRFSLRTMLIAMTLVAIVLGLVVWAVRL